MTADTAVAMTIVSRVVIAARKSVHAVKAADADFADRAFGTARKHHVGVTAANDPGRFTDCMQTGGASRHGGKVRTAQVFHDANQPRSHVDDATGDHEGRDAARTPSGEWYYASLCGRPWRHDTEPAHGTRGWCTLGRETSIQKVEWDEDGWPRVVGGHGGQRYVDAPKDAIETVAPATRDERDEFESDELGPNWNTLRVPFTDAMGTVGDGKLALRGQGSLCNLFDLSLVARRWQAFDFDAETKVRFDPKNYMQMAGLTNYYDDLCWSWAFVTWDEKRHARVIEVAQNDFNQYTSFLKDDAIVVPEDAEAVWLRTKVRTEYYSYEYSFDGEHFTEIPVKLDAKILSDDYVNQRYGGFFTGAFVGLACVDLSGYDAKAEFDYFDYRELPDNR